MSTPSFLPQDDSNYNAVRFYTALDPYFYSVDNRPLQDLETNLKASRSGGGDSARRAAAIGGLNLSQIAAEIFSTKGQTSALSGLKVYKTGSNTVRIGPGAYYEARNINTDVGDQVIKQAMRALNTDFTLTSPVSVGTSVVYTVEGQFIELTDANLAASQVPYVDSNNVYLSSVLMHGELRLSLLSGIASNTGSEQPAATTSGKFPIYNITVTQGSTNYTVKLHNSAPRFNGLYRTVQPVPLATGGATVNYTDEVQKFVLVNGSTTGVILPSILDEREVNPYMPIKLKINFTSTVTGGNVALRLRYKGFNAGDLTTAAKTSTAVEAVAITGATSEIQTYTTTLSVPALEFAGFVSNLWSVNKVQLSIILERVGADALDTNTGDTSIISVSLVQ